MKMGIFDDENFLLLMELQIGAKRPDLTVRI
jgi:hypothetical protein